MALTFEAEEYIRKIEEKDPRSHYIANPEISIRDYGLMLVILELMEEIEDLKTRVIDLEIMG